MSHSDAVVNLLATKATRLQGKGVKKPFIFQASCQPQTIMSSCILHYCSLLQEMAEYLPHWAKAKSMKAEGDEEPAGDKNRLTLLQWMAAFSRWMIAASVCKPQQMTLQTALAHQTVILTVSHFLP